MTNDVQLGTFPDEATAEELRRHLIASMGELTITTAQILTASR